MEREQFSVLLITIGLFLFIFLFILFLIPLPSWIFICDKIFGWFDYSFPIIISGIISGILTITFSMFIV